jgi:hypothetical protein
MRAVVATDGYVDGKVVNEQTFLGFAIVRRSCLEVDFGHGFFKTALMRQDSLLRQADEPV